MPPPPYLAMASGGTSAAVNPSTSGVLLPERLEYPSQQPTSSPAADAAGVTTAKNEDGPPVSTRNL